MPVSAHNFEDDLNFANESPTTVFDVDKIKKEGEPYKRPRVSPTQAS